MKRVRNLCVALCVLGLMWAIFTWPLPRLLLEGIPCSAGNTEKGHVRAMISGDHLQLRYHFWLLSDMLRGRTPWMSNPYEFNEGDDAARFAPGSYYIPFSLLYAAGERLAGAAFGWNLASLAAILAMYGFIWALARRYAPDGWTAAAAALVGVTFPYRWTMLLGGSPSGFGMAMVPLFLLGLDRAIRDDDWRGGLLAGVALFLTYCSDLQTFFFSVLATPLWGGVALCARSGLNWRSRDTWQRLAGALAWALPGCLAVLAFAVGFKGRLAGTDIQAGRTLADVALFSPVRSGLVTYARLGVTNHIFIGWTVLLALAAGLVVLARQARGGTADDRRRLVVFLLIAAGLAVFVELALGTHGLRGGILLRLARALLPPYGMVRQPAKIFTIAPSLFAVVLAMALGALLSRCGAIRRGAALVAWVGLMAAEHRVMVQPTICLLDREQAAYAAVADDAARRQAAPRALVLPLWPGDSHWSSIYEHYASLYRIRMVNGYAPVLKKRYIESVFQRYALANQGVLDDAQADSLLAGDIRYVLFHEAAFPEQVSPFPAGLTLARLCANPRLERMVQGGDVWAFRIRDQARSLTAGDVEPSALLSSRRWEAERLRSTHMTPRAERGVSGGHMAVLSVPGAAVRVETRTRVAPAPGLRWMVRLRGEGVVVGETKADGQHASRHEVTLAGQEWIWREWPAAAGCVLQGFSLRLESGEAQVDMIMLAAGDLLQGQGCRAVTLPAALCFHAGYTVPGGGVALDPRREADGEVLYASGLLLDSGEYELTMAATSPAPAGTVLGELRVRGEDVQGMAMSVKSGQPLTTMTFVKTGNLPLRVAFQFARNAPIVVGEFRVQRRDEP